MTPELDDDQKLPLRELLGHRELAELDVSPAILIQGFVGAAWDAIHRMSDSDAPLEAIYEECLRERGIGP